MPVRRVAKNKTVVESKKEPTQKKPGAGLDKSYTYELFTEYMALPTVVRGDVFRDKEGNPLQSQRDFAEAYDIEESRLSEYKKTEEYEQKVSKKRRSYFKGEIGDAIQAVLINVMQNGKGADLKVLLEYAKEVERDDPTGEVGEQLTSILKKLNAIIPG